MILYIIFHSPVSIKGLAFLYFNSFVSCPLVIFTRSFLPNFGSTLVMFLSFFKLDSSLLKIIFLMTIYFSFTLKTFLVFGHFVLREFTSFSFAICKENNILTVPLSISSNIDSNIEYASFLNSFLGFFWAYALKPILFLR